MKRRMAKVFVTKEKELANNIMQGEKAVRIEWLKQVSRQIKIS